jgi:long-chain fatty acid transport protein
MHRLHHRLAAAAIAVLASTAMASAQGYGVYEHGACAMGRAGAAVAAPCPDGSSIFFNPAAIALASGQELSIGGTLITPRGGFINDRTGLESQLNDRNYPVPGMYYVRPLSERFAAGLGVFAPYGLTTDWPESSEGRFLGYKSLVQAVYVQPTLAMRVNKRLSVGGGIDITRLAVELRQRVDLSTVPISGTPLTFALLGVPAGTDFADVQLKGHAWHAGYHVGMHLQATDTVAFGARYLSGQRVAVDNGELTPAQIKTGLVTPVALPGIPAGTPMDAILAAQFQPGAALSAQKGTTPLPLPSQLVAGLAVQVTPRVLALADYQFTKWSMFDSLVIEREFAGTAVIVENYRNTHGVRFGAEYAFTPSTTIRAGFLTHGAAAPDETVTPNLPEGRRVEYTAGLGTRLNGRLRVDVAYQYLDQKDRAGRTTDGGMAIPTPAVNNGIYSFHAHMFGATLSLSF